MSLVTLMTPVSSFPDLPELSDFEDFGGEDTAYFPSSISSLMKAPESRSCCCPSLREKLFPSLETKLFKIMQKEDFLPALLKLRESIKDNAKLQRFYVQLLPLIIDNPQIFYDVGIPKDVAVLTPLLIGKINDILDPSKKVAFFLQFYKLEKQKGRLSLLEPLLTRYIEESTDFKLFDDASFICIFHNKSCQLNKDVFSKLINYLEKNGKLFECIEILTLAEIEKEKDTPFRSTNLLSQITATYGTQIFTPVLSNLQQSLVVFFRDVDVSEYQHDRKEVSRLATAQYRKSMAVARKLKNTDFTDIFKKLKRKGFPKIEEKNKRFYALVDGFISELFACSFPEEGNMLLRQRKEILEGKGYDTKKVGVYLGELLFLRVINPRLITMKMGNQQAVILQLAKVLQSIANHTTYEDINHLSWMNPYLGEFSGKFDKFIANLDESKKSKEEVE